MTKAHATVKLKEIFQYNQSPSLLTEVSFAAAKRAKPIARLIINLTRVFPRLAPVARSCSSFRNGALHFYGKYQFFK